jgi:hypothetical protein
VPTGAPTQMPVPTGAHCNGEPIGACFDVPIVTFRCSITSQHIDSQEQDRAAKLTKLGDAKAILGTACTDESRGLRLPYFWWLRMMIEGPSASLR